MTTKAYLKTLTWLHGVLWVLLSLTVSPALAQLNENCVVSILNRTVLVKPDGTWVLPNIPANFGPVRARATCVENGVTLSGQSNFFTIPANGSVDVPQIVLGPVTPVPNQVTIAASSPSLTQAGQTVQLTVTAKYADGTTKDIGNSSTGTQYLISNPKLATVSADGLVTAKQSGAVIVQAINEGTQGLLQLSVALSRDTDGDGIPDDAELSLGLNPNNPADALDDLDRDGLTNLKEYQLGTDLRNPDTDSDGLKDGEEVRLGTNPQLADTDGDGVPDGVEVAAGSNPLDSKSVDLAKSLKRITVAPTNFVINVNSVDLLAYQQLTVTGEFTLGGTINLTARAKGTNYTSSDLQICNFGAEDGRVFGGTDGTCTVTVSNNGFTATVTGTVRTFTPKALSYVSIPGFANNVDVSGNYAYVAAGSTGLQVVDVSNRASPQVVASLDTPGNANDVAVVGNFAYVADDSSGLRIINISNPLAPSLAGALDTAGIAWDVVVRGGYAFVADGTSGLKIINVSSPSTPSLVGSLALSGTAKGVDVDLTRKLVVVGGDAGVQVVNIDDLSAPVLLGTMVGGNVRDVVVDGNFVFRADTSYSFTVVDITTPATPVVAASLFLNTGGWLQDIAVSGNFALGADVSFVNVVPIIDVSNPTSPQPRPIIDFSQLRNDKGTGIVVDGSFVYLTADPSGSENGVIGDTRLYIGQYRSQEDRGGIPPTVSITAPTDGSTIIQGQQLAISAQATDDVAVAAVTFNINGVDVFTDTTSPYETTYAVPGNATSLTIVAKAIDLGNNLASSIPVSVTAIPDPLTTVIGRVLDKLGSPVSGASVICQGFATTSSANGTFVVSGVGTISGAVGCNATITDNQGKVLSGASQRITPVRAGQTDVGDITLSEARLETDIGSYFISFSDTYQFLSFSNGFSFKLFGTSYSGIYVNSHGRLTFDYGNNYWWPTLEQFTQQPQVVAYLADLIGGSGGVYVNEHPDRLVVTWKDIPDNTCSGYYGVYGPLVQAILFSDGRIQFAYQGVTGYSYNGIRVGLSSGPTIGNTVDYSQQAPFSTGGITGIHEYWDLCTAFDLDNKILVFTPNGAGGYNVDIHPLQ